MPLPHSIKKLTSWLRLFVFEVIRDELKSIFRLSLFGAALAGYLLPALSGHWQKLHTLLTLQLTQSEFSFQIWHLILFLSFLITGFFIASISIKLKSNKSGYMFIEACNMFWRTPTYRASIEQTPYCPIHRTKLVKFSDGLWCNKCDTATLEKPDSSYLEKAHEIAQNKAECVIHKHKYAKVA